MKLHGVADAFRGQLETTDASQLSFEERFAMLVDQQWLWKENRALAWRLRAAKLKERGVVEDIDYQHSRGLDRKLIRTLASSEWVRQHQNLLLIGPTGIGKTWLGARGGNLCWDFEACEIHAKMGMIERRCKNVRGYFRRD
jgi:DNA replication protein DnaC